MKKIFALAVAAALALGMTACSQSAQPSGSGNAAASNPSAVGSAQSAASTPAPADSTPDVSGLTTVENGKLIMSTNASFPPYEMTTDAGGFEGIDVEIAGLIAGKLGLELQIDDMDFDAALLAVQQGKSDMVMAGVSVTEDRMAVMDFSNSYATGVQVVIVQEDSDVTMDNLGDHMIGTQRATTGYIYASDTPENGGYGEDHVIAYDNGASAVQALMNGQVDCVIIDSAPAQEYVKANSGLTILEGDWVTEDYAIGMAKGNTALVDAVNAALDELSADGSIQTVVDKYINAN